MQVTLIPPPITAIFMGVSRQVVILIPISFSYCRIRNFCRIGSKDFETDDPDADNNRSILRYDDDQHACSEHFDSGHLARERL